MTPLILLAALSLGQSDKLGDPAPRVTVKLGDPFEARPLPASWRVRRATAQAKPAPILGRSVPERLDTLEYNVAQLKIDEPKEWKPKPGPAAEPPATQVKAPPKAAMPPPGLIERVDLRPVIDRLDRVEAKLAELLAKVEASARQAAAPPAARTDNAPARMPAAATPPPQDRWVPANDNPAHEVYGHEDETGWFRYTARRQNARPIVATPPMLYGAFPASAPTFSQSPGFFSGGGFSAPAATYSFPLATYGGFGQQAPCIGSNCGQPQGLFGGLVGGRFR